MSRHDEAAGKRAAKQGGAFGSRAALAFSVLVLIIASTLCALPAHGQKSRGANSATRKLPRKESKPVRSEDPCVEYVRSEPGVKTVGARGGNRSRVFRFDPFYYLSLKNIRGVTVSEAHGNADPDPLAGGPSQYTLKGITYDDFTADGLLIMLPADGTYFVKFRTGVVHFDSMLEGASVEMVRGCGNERLRYAVRYNDIELPKKGIALLKITPQGAESLSLDKDGDGTFEADVVPAASVSGRAAEDQSGPVVNFTEEVRDGVTTVTIKASDPSGVRAIYYGLGTASNADSLGLEPARDGKFLHPYRSSLRLDAARAHHIVVLAEDILGNRAFADLKTTVRAGGN